MGWGPTQEVCRCKLSSGSHLDEYKEPGKGRKANMVVYGEMPSKVIPSHLLSVGRHVPITQSSHISCSPHLSAITCRNGSTIAYRMRIRPSVSNHVSITTSVCCMLLAATYQPSHANNQPLPARAPSYDIKCLPLRPPP